MKMCSFSFELHQKSFTGRTGRQTILGAFWSRNCAAFHLHNCAHWHFYSSVCMYKMAISIQIESDPDDPIRKDMLVLALRKMSRIKRPWGVAPAIFWPRGRYPLPWSWLTT